MSNSSIWSIDRTLSGATIMGQNGPGSNGNEGVISTPQISSITGTSPSDCLVSYQGHFWVVSYSSAGMQLVYSTALANWADRLWDMSLSLSLSLIWFQVLLSNNNILYTIMWFQVFILILKNTDKKQV